VVLICISLMPSDVKSPILNIELAVYLLN